jgi:hypothetical protein
MHPPEGGGSGDYPGWLSLREIDAALGLDKGCAFRGFKRLLPQLTEGQDFLVLDHQRYGALASKLHAAGRLYRSSVSPVLLRPEAAARLIEALRASE